MRAIRHWLRACAIAAAALLAAPAGATVTAFFSSGTTCGGGASANFVTGGSPVKVSLCASTTTEALCGATLQVQSANAGEGGRFFITNRALASAFPDANAASLTYPVAITNPPAEVDLGGTVNVATPNPAGANVLLATFDVAPQASATNNSYVLSLGGFSSIASESSNCLSGLAVDLPLTASFTLNRVTSPLITSATSATFTVNTPSSFTFTATGTPAPTLTLAGALPSGVSFTSATGTLAGTPALGTVGIYNLTITATSSAGSDSRFFTLNVVRANQTITFTGPPDQAFSPAPITLVASASSGLPVSFVSGTSAVCTVSGNTLTMLSGGTCTIVASQAGSNNYNAAPEVTQSFVITATVPGAPTINAATPGDARATIGFTPPANSGGSPISAYTATCNPGAISASAASSPITVAPLVNGTSYGCSVTATNGVGTSAASAILTVTPTAASTPPTIASPASAIFVVNAAGSFTVVAVGTPAPSVSLSGRLPGGVTFNASTGVLSGTPSLGTVADYALTITATNASGTATQAFTLHVVKADQVISFTGPANQPFSSTPIALSATASSGLPVAFASMSPAVCTVAGASVTMLASGTCTVAANQAGDANYNPAPTVTRSFTIGSGVPGAPIATAAVPFSGAVLLYFSPPPTDGGSTILSYTATCNPGAIAATGVSSPLRVTGLANGTAYSCSVAATNANGTGPASASLAVTPAVTRTFSAPSATGSGTITATFTGGGASCSFTSARFIPLTGDPESPPAGSAPVGVAFPHGLFVFSIGGCTPAASITLTITYPATLPPNAAYWKYGPTPTNASPVWYVLPAGFNAAVATLTIRDGGLGDDDLAPNGTIVDQGGPGIGIGSTPIPTLAEWAMMLLAALLLLAGMRRLHSSRTFRP